MDKKRISEIRTKIEAEIKSLEEKILRLKETSRPISPDNSIGRVSRMDAINNKSVNDAALRSAEQKLLKLKIAFEKVEEAEFGQCVNCGNEIQEGRLLFMPESAFCVQCASRA